MCIKDLYIIESEWYTINVIYPHSIGYWIIVVTSPLMKKKFNTTSKLISKESYLELYKTEVEPVKGQIAVPI